MNPSLIRILLIYSLAHFGLLLTTGIYIDSWTIIHGDEKLVIENMAQSGRPWMGYLLNLILAQGGPFPGRLWIFLMYLLSGILLYKILEKEKVFAPAERFFLATFFVIFPVDISRVVIIIIFYVTCYAIFYVGFYCISVYLENRKPIYRVASCAAFFIAFSHNSLLVLYGFVLLYICYKEMQESFNLKRFWVLVKKYADMITLPLVFWVIQARFFRPWGNYQNYNKIQVAADDFGAKFGKFIVVLWKNVYGGFFEVLYESLRSMVAWDFLLFMILTAFLWALFKKDVQSIGENKKDVWLLLVGGIAFFLAIFPYAAVGKFSTQTDYDSRHSQLVPLGVSLILYFGLKILAMRLKMKPLLFAVLLCGVTAFFITSNIRNYFEYWQDEFKYSAFVELARNNETIKSHTTFGVVDYGCGEEENLNAQRRFLRFYEYSGLLKLAFNDTSRMAGIMCREPWDKRTRRPLTWEDIQIFERLLDGVRGGGHKIKNHRKTYNLDQWEPAMPTHVIYIRKKVDAIDTLDLIAMKWYEIFDEKKFKKSLRNIITVQVENYEHL